MNFRKILLIFCLFLGYGSICWGKTTIKIENKGYANIPLRIYTYENLLTHFPKLIQTVTVNEQGKAEFSINLRESQLLYIPIFSFQLVFYATPDTVLTLDLPNFTELQKAFKQLKSYSKREIPLFLKENTSLNKAITNYDKEYNTFIRQHFKAIYNKKQPKKYQKQITPLRMLYSGDFFKKYTTYKEAYISYIAGVRTELLPNYYANRPLELHNTAYVSLLRKLAQEPATDFPYSPNYEQFYKQFLQAKTYSNLKKVYKGLATTNDANFNEHFFIYIMHWCLQDKLISKKLIFKKLALIAQHSPNKINKALAKSMLPKIKFKGKKAPQFKLQATNGKTYTEKILQSSTPTLLTFLDGFKNNDENITALKDLQNKYKGKFKTLIFSAQQEITNVPKSWVQIVLPYHSYLLSDYHLGRFPYYVLVTADGKISQQTWQQYFIGLDKK